LKALNESGAKTRQKSPEKKVITDQAFILAQLSIMKVKFPSYKF